MILPPHPHTVVLVEGESDRCAVEAAARRLQRDLAGEGVLVVATGGATNFPRAVADWSGRDPGVRLAGLCDAAEEIWVRRALERARVEAARVVAFPVCHEDLEDELIRALGADAVQEVLSAEGDLGPFRTLQRQSAQRDRPVEQQLHRFLGSGSGRKIRYAGLLVEALEPDDLPEPLARLLAALALPG